LIPEALEVLLRWGGTQEMRGVTVLTLLGCLSMACAMRSQEPDIHASMPSVKQWEVGREPLQIDAVPPLVAVWAIDFDTLPGVKGQLGDLAGIALTSNIVVVSYCSSSAAIPGCGTHNLISLDLKTGKFLSSISRPGVNPNLYPLIYAGTAKTFLIEFDGHLTEYDEALKPTQDVILPRGTSLSLRRTGYSFSGIWLNLTKTKCTQPDVYALNERWELIVGCGHEVAVTEEKGDLLFAQTFFDPYTVGAAAFSHDGTRFVLGAGLNYPGDPPLHANVGYLLYDLNGKTPREILFDIETNTGRKIGPWVHSIGLSPDGTMFGIERRGKLWMYNLPK